MLQLVLLSLVQSFVWILNFLRPFLVIFVNVQTGVFFAKFIEKLALFELLSLGCKVVLSFCGSFGRRRWSEGFGDMGLGGFWERKKMG